MHKRLMISLMETGIPIFHQVVVTIVVAENDTPIRLQIEPCNLSTTTPLVINRDIVPLLPLSFFLFFRLPLFFGKF